VEVSVCVCVCVCVCDTEGVRRHGCRSGSARDISI
jgi:hypothetical protein